jgi:hypothetical protein
VYVFEAAGRNPSLSRSEFYAIYTAVYRASTKKTSAHRMTYDGVLQFFGGHADAVLAKTSSSVRHRGDDFHRRLPALTAELFGYLERFWQPEQGADVTTFAEAWERIWRERKAASKLTPLAAEGHSADSGARGIGRTNSRGCEVNEPLRKHARLELQLAPRATAMAGTATLGAAAANSTADAFTGGLLALGRERAVVRIDAPTVTLCRTLRDLFEDCDDVGAVAVPLENISMATMAQIGAFCAQYGSGAPPASGGAGRPRAHSPMSKASGMVFFKLCFLSFYS